MAQHSLLRLAVYLLLAPGLLVNAQENTEIQRTQPAAKTKMRAKANSNPELDDAVGAQRRVIAVSLITALADEARGFRDQTRRARVQAQAADTLWETDEERARDLFRRAWEAAEIADIETAKQQTEDVRKQTASGGPIVLRSRPEVRNEVLRLVAKRDAKLGEEFLKNLSESGDRETNEAAAELKRHSLNTFNASAAAARRLKLARQLLDDGDIERAIQFAGPVLDQVNVDSIFFLSALRTKNSQAADAGFSSLMARVARDPASDANTVAGLSSYLFTPFLYVTFAANGGSNAQQQRAATPPPADLPNALRDTFFRVASGIFVEAFAAARPGSDFCRTLR